MRPRPDTAENAVSHVVWSDWNTASMRPRPDTAENMGRAILDLATWASFNEAAARYRGKRSPCPRPSATTRSCFNEAAARYRGKLLRGGRRHALHHASMRPRPDTAENEQTCEVRDRWPEASMRPRPDTAENDHRHDRRGDPHPASMRPRPDTAENGTPITVRQTTNVLLQ